MGMPKRAKILVLITNDTGTRAAPEKCSPKNQCDQSTPGARKSTRVLRKASRGNAATMPFRGPSRIKAPTLDATIAASSDRGLRANPILLIPIIPRV